MLLSHFNGLNVLLVCFTLYDHDEDYYNLAVMQMIKDSVLVDHNDTK